MSEPMAPRTTDALNEHLFEYLRDNLRVEVVTTSEYTGGMDGGDMYAQRQTVRLVLCGEVISEATS